MNMLEAIKKRRSVRTFLEDDIPDSILNEILDSARYAPTAGNGQSHRFGIIKDKNQKIALAEAAGNQHWIAKAPVIIACCAELDSDMNDLEEDDFGLLVNRTRFGKEWIDFLCSYEDRYATQIFWSNSVPLIPGEHIVLTAASYGIASCWVGYLDVKKVSDILKLPKSHACLFLLPLGYAGVSPKMKTLKTFEEIYFNEQWEDNNESI